jgi:hypothetical protein
LCGVPSEGEVQESFTPCWLGMLADLAER